MRINRDLMAVLPAHFGIDFTTFAINIVFPLLAAKLELTFTQVGVAAGLHIAANGMSQPLFGMLGDRLGARRLLTAAIFFQGLFIGLATQAGTYPILLALLVLSAVASGAFHSLGLGAANQSSSTGKGSAVGMFFLAGNTGFAVSPVVTGFFVETMELGLTFPLYLIAFSVATSTLYFLLTRPRIAAAPAAGQPPENPPGRMLNRLLAPLAAMSVFRGLAFGAAPVFIPFAFIDQGASLQVAGLALSVFSAGAAIGVFGGGWLSDRFGSKSVIALPLLFGTPVFMVMVVTIGTPLSFFAAFGAGFLIQTPQTPSVVMIQQAMSARMATASGLALGFIFSVQAAGQALTGVIADSIGVQLALAVIAMMPILGFLSSLAIPGRLMERSPWDRTAAPAG